ALGCAGLFYELARGQYGWLLRLTYGPPIWSAFRDAFKFLPFSLAAIALAGGLGLEMCWRQTSGRGRLAGLGVALSGAAGLLLMSPGPVFHLVCPSAEVLGTWSGRVSLVAGLVLLVVTGAGGQGWARWILLLAVPIEMAGVVALCHYESHHTYHQPYG